MKKRLKILARKVLLIVLAIVAAAAPIVQGMPVRKLKIETGTGVNCGA